MHVHKKVMCNNSFIYFIKIFLEHLVFQNFGIHVLGS
jgi:hypothetical protein